MSQVEKLLEQMSLREPSGELDQRVGESVTLTPMRPSVQRRPSWWGLLTACGACLLVGILAGRQWPPEHSGADSSDAVVVSLDVPDGTDRDESPVLSPLTGSASPPSTLALDAEAGVNPDDRTIVSDGTFLLVNGQPVRRHRTFRTRRVRVYSGETDQFREIEIPIRRDVVIASQGI